MIDCKKIKLANEASLRHYEVTGETVVLEINFSYGCRDCNHVLWINGEQYFGSIDELIDKLQKTTYKESKYKVGQEVWFLNAYNEIQSMSVDRIKYENSIYYLVSKSEWAVKETACYPTKESLIEAQIKYWTKLHPNYISEKQGNDKAKELMDDLARFAKTTPTKVVTYFCDHVSDTSCYFPCPEIKKCMKCGEFYR